MLDGQGALIALRSEFVEAACEHGERHIAPEDRDKRRHDTNWDCKGNRGTLIDARNREGNGQCSRSDRLRGDGATDIDGAHEDRLKRRTYDDTRLHVPHKKARDEADHKRSLDHALTEEPVAAVADHYGQPSHACQTNHVFFPSYSFAPNGALQTLSGYFSAALMSPAMGVFPCWGIN